MDVEVRFVGFVCVCVCLLCVYLSMLYVQDLYFTGSAYNSQRRSDGHTV